MTTVNSRPPLREIPLSEAPAPVNVPKSHKRSLSPDGPRLFSPAKRRILCEEGILSPQKMSRTPFRSRDIFSDLRTESSPAKRLDFSVTKRTEAECTSATKIRNLASSSELASRTPHTPSPAHHNRTPNPAEDDFFATPDRLPLLSRSSKSSRTIPRELPACSEVHSIHYPGFQVHRDAFIVIPEPINIELFAVEAAKENMPPRKALRKITTEASCVDGKAILPTPSSKKRDLEKLVKAKSTPVTPKKVAGKDRLVPNSPTPQRPALSLGAVQNWVGTPIVSEEQRILRKQLMMEEVEDNENGDSVGF
ncbi:hypothetical protein Moror_8116 [Moniliophthora roreri MCA 2997]|uniref:Uncharacterized protein n=2 Tax=Moniliophthora roreri TaxID=221103 RepID=V2X5P4_MONRO|nr:hypothetical protein Moror_8116 [Moniliophthora roreri MCA 2997]